MSELKAALGLSEDIEYKGKVYKFGPTTVEVIARWEGWLEQLAFEAALRRLKNEEKAAGVVAEQSARGAFDFFGDASAARQTTLKGRQKFFYFMIAQNHPDVVEATIQEMVEDQFMEIYRKFLMNQPPNSEAPVDPTAGAFGGEVLSPASSATVSEPSMK